MYVGAVGVMVTEGRWDKIMTAVIGIEGGMKRG